MTRAADPPSIPITARGLSGTRTLKPGREGDLVTAVISYINARGGMAWRQNAGVTVIESKGRRRAIHSGRKGLPDVIGIRPVLDIGVMTMDTTTRLTLPPGRLGQLIAVECKRPGNKPTPAQEFMLAELRKRGALVVVAYSVKDVEAVLA